MARILLGIATHQPDQRFLESLPLFYAQAVKKHDIEIKWVWHKPLVDAQNEIVDHLMAGNYEYLLTIEDDHHGFTADMLESCLKRGDRVCGISYRSRHFPFEKIPMRKVGDAYGGMSNVTSGYHVVDLIAFGFTIFKKEVFNLLDKPYFRLNVVGGIRTPRATDINLSKRLQAKGVELIGCYDHDLLHRDIEEHKIREMIVEGVMAKHSLYTRLNSMLENDRQQKKEEQICHSKE